MKYLLLSWLLILNYSTANLKSAENVVDIKIIGVNIYGQQVTTNQVKIEEIVYKNLKPFLSYIFFVENSSEIQSKYNQLNSKSVKDFNEFKMINSTALGIHYDALNIIGDRMLKTAKAKLTIIGCNANVNDEGDNLKLSKARAETVKNYLVDVWKIDEKRLIINARNLPLNPSKKSTSNKLEQEAKNQENRRVEFSAQGFENDILGPIICYDTVRHYIPDLVRIKVTIKDTNLLINSWLLKAGKEIFERDSKYYNDDYLDLPEYFEWNLSANRSTMPIIDQDINFEFKDHDNKEYRSKTYHLKVSKTKSTEFKYQYGEGFKNISYQTLYFDFDKSDIALKDKSYLEIIKNESIENTSKINITGYTDNLGPDKKNIELSKSRANSLARYINKKNINTIGVGASKPIFKNNTPEGRFLNRTVILNIQTPIEK